MAASCRSEVLLFELPTKANETKFTFKDILTRTKIRYSKNFHRILAIRYLRNQRRRNNEVFHIEHLLKRFLPSATTDTTRCDW